MKSATIFKMLATVLGASALFSAHAASTLTVYTALEADQIKAYQAAFEKANPDIEIKWVRDSTGIVTAKLLAEKNNPKADVIWGLAASSLAILDKEGMLESYAPKNLNNIEAKYRSAANPPSWVGMDVWGSAICFNTVEAQKLNLPKPTSWADLTKPIYAGKIVMPHPASSGTEGRHSGSVMRRYVRSSGTLSEAEAASNSGSICLSAVTALRWAVV